MIGLDTNVLARLFVDDDLAQAELARGFVTSRCTAQSPGHVDRVALCEMIWVLTSVHKYGRAEIVNVVEELLASNDIILEDAATVRVALRTFASRDVDFADVLIGEVNRARGCEVTATFDRKAAKLDGFILVA
jgi:predicted nucleic-acid-binding protein